MEGEKIREELKDEATRIIRVGKLLSIVKKQDEKLQQMNKEIRRLRNIIKEPEKVQQMVEEIRTLRIILKAYVYKIKVIRGIEEENS